MLAKRWLTVCLICLGILLLLAAVKFFQIKAAIEFGESFPEPSETVEYEAVSIEAWEPTIEVIGEILAPQEVELRTEVAGVISRIGFRSGAQVAKGDTLLQLDVAEERALLAALKPQLTLAQQDYSRLSNIKNKEAVSRQLIDRARSRLGVAQGEVASINERIVNKTIVAPFDGISGLHDFEVGEYLAADTLVTRLVGDSDELWVDFRLPQQHSKLSVGAEVNISASKLFNGVISGVVSVVEPTISRESRTLGVRATLQKSDKLIRPGSFVTVTVPTGEPASVIRLPSTAVRRDPFGNFVFLLKQDDQQKWRASRVRVDEMAKEEFSSILQPTLNEGDLVASVGAFKLRDGVWVKLAEPEETTSQVAPSEASPKFNSTEQPTEVREAAELIEITETSSSPDESVQTPSSAAHEAITDE